MKENGYEYVDLGLPSKTMWATCNVGATKPEDEGLLFQFGRVDGYKYGDKNHKFRTNAQNKQDTGSEYIPLTTSGNTYDKGTTLNLEDDAAHVNMGGQWRIPTKDQLEELYDNTTHNVVVVNGVQGMMYVSNINGNKLFIPFMQGGWYNGIWEDVDRSYVRVWSSQVHTSYVNDAYRLSCYLRGYAINSYNTRSCTFTVRGVFIPNCNNINMLI